MCITVEHRDPVKTYQNTIEAIRDYLAYLESRGELNTVELERMQLRAGLSNAEILSGSMLRQIKSGEIVTTSALRSEAFCRVVGIEVFIVAKSIPTDFTRPTTTTSAVAGDEATPQPTKKQAKKQRKAEA